MTEMKAKVQSMFDDLEAGAYSFGGLSCYIFMNKCYMTLREYENYENEQFYENVIEGTFSTTPRNRLVYHSDNGWALQCFKTLYWAQHNVIPHCCFENQFNHTLPQRVLIPRSSGINTVALTRSQEYGTRFRKSRTNKDSKERIYVRVSWLSDTMSKENDDAKESVSCFDGLFKDVDLEDIVRLNPEIKEKGVEFILNYIKVEESMNEMQKQVIEKCNKRLEEWCKKTLQPILDFYTNSGIVIITYKIV